MLTAINMIAIGVEYAGDILLGIGAITFLALVYLDDGIA